MLSGRTLLAVLAFAGAAHVAAEETSLDRYATVTVAPAKTSIYVGSVTLTTPGFTREGATYSANYTAKVFPYFFYNEKGRIWIDVADADLRRLEHGETVNFTGHARNDDGEERRVEGRAEPAGPATGKIKVRIWVSKRIELIFNTTYRFPKV